MKGKGPRSKGDSVERKDERRCKKFCDKVRKECKNKEGRDLERCEDRLSKHSRERDCECESNGPTTRRTTMQSTTSPTTVRN